MGGTARPRPCVEHAISEFPDDFYRQWAKDVVGNYSLEIESAFGSDRGEALRSLAEKSSVFSPAFGHSAVARDASPEPVTLPVNPGFQGDSVGRETSQAGSSGTMDPAR